MCLSGSVSGDSGLGGDPRRSGKEERCSRRHGISVGLYKRRHGADATATSRFPARSPRGFIDGWQRDRRVASARSVDLPNISKSDRRSTDLGVEATNEWPRRCRTLLSYKPENVGASATESSVVDRRTKHTRRKLNASDTVERDDDERIAIVIAAGFPRSNDLEIERDQWIWHHRQKR